MRALVEVEGGFEEAHAIAQLIPDGVPQLWHSYGQQTWEVISAGAAAGVDVRVGLEDVLELPDGRVAANNAELVAVAIERTHNVGGGQSLRSLGQPTRTCRAHRFSGLALAERAFASKHWRDGDHIAVRPHVVLAVESVELLAFVRFACDCRLAIIRARTPRT